MTQRALAAAIGVRPRTVTGLVDALQAAGFAVRAPHPGDRRATLVDLTGRGRDTVGSLEGDYDESAARLFDGLPETHLAGFVATVDHLLERIGRENC